MNGKPITIWTLAERSGSGLKPVSLELLSRAIPLRDCARASGREARITAVLLAPYVEKSEFESLVYHGADEVLCILDGRFTMFIVRHEAAALSAVVLERRPDIFLAAATTYGRTLMPYLAARLRAGLTADCTELELDAGTGALFQTRPAVGGNILATIHTPELRPQMATVRPHSTRILEPDTGRKGTITVVQPGEPCFSGGMTLIGTAAAGEGERPVTGAKAVVSGGRGMKSAEGFRLLHELSELLGGAVGGSREAVDRGWVAYPQQVGLSGKTVNPDLYIAAGISGSVQHLAGMQTSKHIVAVNRDPDAQIARVADFTIIGDLFEVIPELIAALRARKRVEQPGGRGVV